MKRMCFSWGDSHHEPLFLGEKEPLSDPRITHGICPDCEAAMLKDDDKEHSK